MHLLTLFAPDREGLAKCRYHNKAYSLKSILKRYAIVRLFKTYAAIRKETVEVVVLSAAMAATVQRTRGHSRRQHTVFTEMHIYQPLLMFSPGAVVPPHPSRSVES